jgi:hypothetical protein
MILALKLAFRSCVRRPLFRAVVVILMALGLTAAIFAFTYVNAFHQPFPGADPDRLVQLFGSDAENPFLDISFLDFQDYFPEAGSFQGDTSYRWEMFG